MVYLCHFEEKLHHAQHYIGFVKTDLEKRISRHRSGRGSKLLAALNKAGIKWQVVRVWTDGDRELERRLKSTKKASLYCPICNKNI